MQKTKKLSYMEKKTIRIVVAVSSGFSDFELFKKKMDRLTEKLDKTKIMVVTPSTPESNPIICKWAYWRMISCEIHYRDTKDRDKAGLSHANKKRNERMLVGAKYTIVFDDGEDEIVEHLLEKSREAKIKTVTIDI